MGLTASLNDPCLLSAVLAKPSSPETISAVQSQLHVGIYVDDFVFSSSYPNQEALFKTLLQEHIQVDFMGDVDYLLGTAFNWIKQKDGNISNHICQSAFTELTAHWLSVQSENKVPNMSPHYSGFPIDSILPIGPINPDIARRRQVYQRMFCCINWLATCTSPEIASALTFLTSYINSPHPQQYKATVHALK